MRKQIPSLIRKKITQESQSICPFCGEDDVATGEIHHIIPLSEGGNSTEDNLIYLCSNCHSKITQGQITRGKVVKDKHMLAKGQHPFLGKKVPDNVIYVDFTKGVNEGVVANRIEKVEIKATRKSVKLNPPTGSIGSSLYHRNYIRYLIDRYHEFKKVEVGREGMKYPVFYGAIKRTFGAKWDMVPLEKFDNLSLYIQSRIEKTIFGRNRKSKGHRIYSTFEEFMNK